MGQVGLRNNFGLTVLASHLPNEQLNTSPSADTPLRAGAQLIVMGTRDQLQRLVEVAAGPAP